MIVIKTKTLTNKTRALEDNTIEAFVGLLNGIIETKTPGDNCPDSPHY